ncbi:MAG TPA: UDP-N-acetylmuramate dehydrogenase [Candidatus Kaiserbacteria bacterium]|nr:UDP-N-acetylmuramate dehydrogenase [Candidatus Kaiserbacteria bacterium]
MIKVRENIQLAPYTTFGVGGVARFFVEANSVGDVVEAFREAKRLGLKVAVLGGGSNTLVRDSGVDGLVLLMRIAGVTFHEKSDGTFYVTAGAGVVWDDLVRETIERELSGIECLSGIPGTVGGAVVSGIGAYGAQVGDTLESVDVIDITSANLSVRNLSAKECALTYHDSIFASEQNKYIVVGATFSLHNGVTKKPTYEDYRFKFPTQKENKKITLAFVRETILNIREEKGALFMKGRKSYNCAGSFFHMPIVSKEEHANILKIARELDAGKEERLRPWSWEQDDGSFKIAPGFLLEYTNFHKGYVRGSVGISPKHILSIIALPGACTADVEMLADDMQKEVNNIFGIRIEREVKLFVAR